MVSASWSVLMKPFLLLLLPIAALLGSASIESAKAHTTRQGDNGGIEVITVVTPPLAKVINYRNGEDIKVTVDCSTWNASFQLDDGDRIDWHPASMVTGNKWIGTWKNGRILAVDEAPSVIYFVYHAH